MTMYDFDYAYFWVIAWLKKGIQLFLSKRIFVADQLKILGTAAYTSAFVYVIEKGFDLNFGRLAIIGLTN